MITKGQLIATLREKGIKKFYGKTLSQCTKKELDLCLRTFEEGTATHYLSPAQINMFLKCGIQYYFRYVELLRIPPTGAAVLGLSLHKGLEYNFREYLRSGQHEPLNVIEDKMYQQFRAQSGEAVWKEKPDVGFQEARLCMKNYHEDELQKVVPETVEEEVVIQLNQDLSVKGRLDLVDIGVGKKIIIDHKLRTRRMNEQNVKDDLQLSFYSLAKKIPDVGFNILIRPKGTIQVDLRDQRSVAAQNRVKLYCGYVADAITRKTFLPAAPGSWWCSPNWCGYWDLCHRELS